MKLTVKFAGVFAVLAFALTAVSADAAFLRDLTLGSTGSDVIELQTWLEAKGFLVIPAGVSKGYFGALTQSALAKYQMSAGITPAAGYFGPITRAKIAAGGTVTPPSNGGNSGLSGEDGDIQSVNQTTSGTETTLGEGKSEDVLGFDVEADDNSDLDVTSIKVEIATESGESTRLTRYLDSVSIMLDGDEVGSVDASDFSRDGATSTATISLDDAVIEAGDEARFYVNFTAADTIGDSELDASLNVEVTRVRVEDGSGAVLTEDVDDVSDTVDFEDASSNDDARIKSSSDTRDAGLLKVDDNTTSDDEDLLTFKFDVDEDSSDLSILEIPVDLVVYNAGQSLNLESMIQDLWIEVDGETYDDYDFETDHTISATSTETVTATFTIDEGDLDISAGDVVDAVVFVKLAKQEGNYATSSTLAANVTGADITAENSEGDVFDVAGTVNGETQTLQLSTATVEDFRWAVNNTGNIIDFFFTVTAEDEDFDVLSSSISATLSGTATSSAGVLSKSTGDATTNSAGVSYTVADGDTATFRIRYSLTGSNGTYKEVTMTSVAGQEVPDEDQVSPTATINVN
jgi:hypothetical protein